MLASPPVGQAAVAEVEYLELTPVFVQQLEVAQPLGVEQVDALQEGVVEAEVLPLDAALKSL
jgi:hypothetical protein